MNEIPILRVAAANDIYSFLGFLGTGVAFIIVIGIWRYIVETYIDISASEESLRALKRLIRRIEKRPEKWQWQFEGFEDYQKAMDFRGGRTFNPDKVFSLSANGSYKGKNISLVSYAKENEWNPNLDPYLIYNEGYRPAYDTGYAVNLNGERACADWQEVKIFLQALHKIYLTQNSQNI